MQNLDYNLQLNEYLKKYYLKEYKTKKMIKHSLLNKFVYKKSNVEAMLKSAVLFYSTNIFIKNCNIDNSIKSQKIYYFNNSFIKVKQNKDNFVLSILIDNNLDIRLELNFNNIDEIEKFIISNFLKDYNYQNYNINFALNNSLNFEHSLYSIIKFYR